MMQKKTIFFVGAVVCLLVAGWLYYLYQKPRAGVTDMKADYTVAASNLYQTFASDEASANARYVNKVLKVEGVVQLVDSSQGNVNVILASNTTDGGINCTLAEKQKKPAAGQSIVVKGLCTGFLLDVNLVDAVWEKK